MIQRGWVRAATCLFALALFESGASGAESESTTTSTPVPPAPAVPFPQIAILCYHHVTETPGVNSLDVSPAE